jgi:hypothetical protein
MLHRHVARGPRSAVTCLTLLAALGCGQGADDDTPLKSAVGATGGDGGSGTSGAGGSGMAAGATGGSSGAMPSSGAGAGAASGAGTGSAGKGGTGGAAGMSTGGAGASGAGKGGSGAAGAGAGAAGSGGMTPGIDSCPAPPSGTPDPVITALNTENTLRVAMGVDCAAVAPALIKSAQAHCDYYTTNQGTSCEAASPHDEIAGCPGFTGAGLGDRFKAAGYTLRGSGSECMAFLDDPAQAVMTFVNSVYHRTSILDPWMRDFGYGGSDGCDTIDFGTGTMSASTITAFYPYADQTGLPTSFDGSREGPTPPVPPSGWPSGYPVTLYAKNFTASAHSFTLDGDTTEIAHQWLDQSDQALPAYAVVLYADAPLTANTKYHVKITGTVSGAEQTFEWSFTTGAASGRPGRN